jgi:hypothetical protein
MGRLRAGVSERQAQEEVDAFMRRLEQLHPATNANVRGEVLAFTQSPRGPQRMLNMALAVLQGIMLLLLLAVCGNVASLMLARATARHKEVGIRLSLGARPARIASLLLSENVLLGLLGAALGLLFAVWGTQGLLVLPMTGLPLRFQTRIDGLTLLFAVLLGVGSGLLFGAAPVDSATATFGVRIRVTETGGLLRPGMFARVAIVYERKPDALQIPRTALLDGDGPPKVFVVHDGKAAERAVKLGLSNGAMTEVVEGLKDGEQVVVVGQGAVKPGAAVRIVNTPARPAAVAPATARTG